MPSPYYTPHEEANFSDRLGVSIESPVAEFENRRTGDVDYEPGPRTRIVIEGERELVAELWEAAEPKMVELNERLSAAARTVPV